VTLPGGADRSAPPALQHREPSALGGLGTWRRWDQQLTTGARHQIIHHACTLGIEEIHILLFAIANQRRRPTWPWLVFGERRVHRKPRANQSSIRVLITKLPWGLSCRSSKLLQGETPIEQPARRQPIKFGSLRAFQPSKRNRRLPAALQPAKGVSIT